MSHPLVLETIVPEIIVRAMYPYMVLIVVQCYVYAVPGSTLRVVKQQSRQQPLFVPVLVLTHRRVLCMIYSILRYEVVRDHKRGSINHD